MAPRQGATLMLHDIPKYILLNRLGEPAIGPDRNGLRPGFT